MGLARISSGTDGIIWKFLEAYSVGNKFFWEWMKKWLGCIQKHAVLVRIPISLGVGKD